MMMMMMMVQLHPIVKDTLKKERLASASISAEPVETDDSM
jgi:hypothetical protein